MSIFLGFFLSLPSIRLIYWIKPSGRETHPLSPSFWRTIINLITDCQLHLKQRFYSSFIISYNMFQSYSLLSPNSSQIAPSFSIHLTSCSFLLLNKMKRRTKLKWGSFCVCQPLLCTGPALKCSWHAQCCSLKKTKFSFLSNSQSWRAYWLGMGIHARFPSILLRIFFDLNLYRSCACCGCLSEILLCLEDAVSLGVSLCLWLLNSFQSLST